MLTGKGFKRLITIDHHITKEENLHPGATGEFTSLLNDLTLAVRIISREVRRAGLNDILGWTNTTNIHGEIRQKLDTYANEILKKAMSQGGHVCAFATEEDDEVTIVSSNKKSKYIILFDPLDGSSNINVNITIGTIFGIYKRLNIGKKVCESIDVLQPGRNLVAAGYALYGSSTLLVYSTGNGVNAFTYDPTIGEFLLSKSNMKIPQFGRQYSTNEGNAFFWDEKVKNFVNYLKTPNQDERFPYDLRYIGTVIADMHRLLNYGGIYLYPANQKYPNGKLRLIYEVNPLVYILEQTGGIATDGKNRILDIVPQQIHQRTPLFMGSPEEMALLNKFLNNTQTHN
jgi:fructose-1,6-bisphosphatase I